MAMLKPQGLMTPASLPWVFLSSLTLYSGVAAGSNEPIRLHVNGVELHYIEDGHGETLILLHGGQGDYRSWAPQMDVFSRHYRVISYSRRYHYPNDNPLT